MDWIQWRDDVFGDPYLVWHEGPEFTELRRRAGTAPDEVARMLTAGIGAGDPLAASSFAVLANDGCAPEGAEALLLAAVPGADGAFLIRAAQALHALTGDESWSAPVVSVLASDEFWGVRIDAAMALVGFAPTAELIASLGRGVCDVEYLVRYHCANTLRRYAGRTRDISDLKLFEKIRGPHDDDDETDAHRAARQKAAEWLMADASRLLG
jgi:hypothetical protein